MKPARLTAPLRRGAVSVMAAAFLLAACGSDQPVASPPVVQGTTPSEADTCEDIKEGRAAPPSDFRPVGKRLKGDTDDDGRADRVTLRSSEDRPAACRHLVVIETASGLSLMHLIEPLDWPSTDPELLLLAEIDGRSGVEAVVALSPGAVFRPGAVFTVLDGALARMRLKGGHNGTLANLFPFYDESPMGVDCTDAPGEIVVTVSRFAAGGNRHGITRTFYKAEGPAFRPLRQDGSVVDCCNEEAARRWPETTDDPFRSCAARVT